MVTLKHKVVDGTHSQITMTMMLKKMMMIPAKMIVTAIVGEG